MKAQRKILIVPIFMIAILASSLGFCGASGKGGADNIWCNDPQLADLVSPSIRKVGGISVGSYYDEILSSGDNRLNNQARITVGEANILATIFNYLSVYRPDEAAPVKAAYDSLSFGPVKEVAKLNTGLQLPLIPSLLGQCVRIPLAVQDFDAHQVTFQVGDLGAERLGDVGHAFFRVHESYVLWAHQQGKNLKEAESLARNTLGDVVNDKNFDQVMIQNFLNQLGASPDPVTGHWKISQFFYAGYAMAWQHSKKNTFEKSVDSFKAKLTQLDLPCNMTPSRIAAFKAELPKYEMPPGFVSMDEQMTIFSNLCN